MSLLTLLQQVARVTPVAIPAVISGSTDKTASLLLGCAQEEGEALSRRAPQGWVAQILENTFTTNSVTTTGNITSGVLQLTGLGTTTGVSSGFIASAPGIPANARVSTVDSSSQVTLATGFAPTASSTGATITFGQADFALPSDFRRLVDDTLWDRSRFWQMRGAMTPQQWQLYKSSPIGRASIQRRWRIRVPSGSAVGTAPTFSIDPIPTDNGSQLVYEYVSNAWCKSSGGTPQTLWAADTDIGILDEYLIGLGVKWRMLERLGMDFSSAREEYERLVDQALGADGGAPVIDMTPTLGTYLLNWTNVPESNYGGH